MTASPDQATADRLPVLLALSDMVEIFHDQDGAKRQTIYRWNSDSGGRDKALPAPTTVLAGKKFWREDVVLEFAASKGLKPDRNVLRRIRRGQGHR